MSRPEPIAMPLIRDARADDAARVCDIYNHYVLHAVATFEESTVSREDMSARIEEVQSQFFWLVYEDERDGVIGYAYAGKWKTRAAYRFSVESSVYIDPAHCGRGIGKALYTELLARLRGTRVHSVVGGVAGDNPASFALHESLGFRKVARFEEIGYKFGQWIPVTYFQVLLDLVP
jgi:L-amino acid N-acyltransferase YncA